MTQPPVMNRFEAQIQDAANRLQTWLLTAALPMWQANGRNLSTGAFAESIDTDRLTAATTPCRSRVPPRQIYVFIEGKRLGWNGPADEIASAALNYFFDHHLLPDGTAGAAVDSEGVLADRGFDLYNQAFVLFGLAHAAEAFPDDRGPLLDRAHSLLTLLRSDYGHRDAGFRESNPDSEPLRSNPHMHLFEAALALDAIEDDGTWSELADEIAEHALTRFIDPVSGGLREFFSNSWAPMPDNSGRIMEPGHQFEWAWLLAGWGLSRGRSDAIIAARRLYQIGERHGIDPDRQVVIMALDDTFEVSDPIARLWGQTEWIKAAITLARLSIGPEQDAYLNDVIRAVGALERFFEGVPAGLWRDKMQPDGAFTEEPAPASSLYHIVCAISELVAFAADIRSQPAGSNSDR